MRYFIKLIGGGLYERKYCLKLHIVCIVEQINTWKYTIKSRLGEMRIYSMMKGIVCLSVSGAID